jgi:hypothetical protein
LKKAGKVEERERRGHGAKVWGLRQVLINSPIIDSLTPETDTTSRTLTDSPQTRPLQWWETGHNVPDGDSEFVEVDTDDSA